MSDYAEDQIRAAVHGWIREVAPLTAKMNLTPRHVDALVNRIATLKARAAIPANNENNTDKS